MLSKNAKKNFRLATIAAGLANGYWASLTTGAAAGHGAAWSPVLLAMVSVWAGYFSLAWLFQGIRSK